MLLLKTETLPDDGERWAYQLKVDGYRAIAFKRGGDVHLRSRNDHDFNTRYATVLKGLAGLPDDTVVDGELVAFDADGAPVRPAVVGEAGETVFTAEGTALLRPGDVARLRMGFWPRRIPARVVYVVDEPRRRGFAYGTLPGHPERGEESFVVERLADDSVWLVIRAFSRPSGPLVWIGYPVARLLQAVYTARYERALAGPLPGNGDLA